jgi:UDP-N-acetylglucosamine 2-epimerase (non-hydrolysing)
MRITVAAGTRPEIIKLSPVVRALRQDGHELRVVATGQPETLRSRPASQAG